MREHWSHVAAAAGETVYVSEITGETLSEADAPGWIRNSNYSEWGPYHGILSTMMGAMGVLSGCINLGDEGCSDDDDDDE